MGYYSYNFVDPDFFHNTLGLYASFPFMSWTFNEKLYKRYRYQLVSSLWIKKNGHELLLKTIDDSFHKVNILDIQKFEIKDEK